MISILLLTTLVLSVIIPTIVNPIRRSPGMIENYILRITPIGKNMDDVICVLEESGRFGSLYIDFNRGFQPSPGERHQGFENVGEMLISSNLGTYHAWYKWFPFMEWSVQGFWIFDANENLIKVHVRKACMS